MNRRLITLIAVLFAALIITLLAAAAGGVSWQFAAVAAAAVSMGCAGYAIYQTLRMREAISRVVRKEGILVERDCLFSKEINSLIASFEDSQAHLHENAEFKDIQLRMLMNQINPHFLYNTLESIRGQAIFNDDWVVADMAETLSIFFRYCISQKGTIVQLNDEIKNVNVFLKIMKFRLPEKFEFNITVDNPEWLEYQIPKLTLQPLIENAILHGINSYKTGGLITLRAVETTDQLKIYIRDNGVGIATEELRKINERLASGFESTGEQHDGIALYNINRRIKLTYGRQYGLRIYSTVDVGTNVTICLPKLRLDK